MADDTAARIGFWKYFARNHRYPSEGLGLGRLQRISVLKTLVCEEHYMVWSLTMLGSSEESGIYQDVVRQLEMRLANLIVGLTN